LPLELSSIGAKVSSLPTGDAFELLSLPRATDRLRGARLLLEHPDYLKLSTVKRLRQSEADSWVIAALDRVIFKWEQAGAAQVIGDGWISMTDAAENEEIRAEAIQSVTQTILHEARPLVTDISDAIGVALGDLFPGSPSFLAIERLRAFLHTVNRLYEAAAPPRYVEFDLADLATEEIREGGFSAEQIVATRSDPVIVIGDPDLLRLALRNAIKNAVEASVTARTPVLVTCGVSDSEGWVSVLDEGVGLPDSSERIWEPGISKKSKDLHFGWGLPIASRAIHSLGGSIRLIPREPIGTSCEIRWPLPSEDGRP